MWRKWKKMDEGEGVDADHEEGEERRRSQKGMMSH